MNSVKSIPSVTVARSETFMCADPSQDGIIKDIKEQGLNRVVVASCTPKMHEITFRNALKRAGLSQYFFEMVNLREHCSFVHRETPKEATDKAISLVKAGIARAKNLEEVPIKEVPVTPTALIIGGGIAGMTAAIDIANRGFKVYLVEKKTSIGGRMAGYDRIFPTDDCAM